MKPSGYSTTLIVLIQFILQFSGLSAQDSGTFTDARDEQQYEWIRIGKQVWMAENLAWLPAVNPYGESGFEVKYYYVYGYNGHDLQAATSTEAYKQYGALYNYTAALHCCPAGWHLPADAEWKELEAFLGMKVVPGNRSWINDGEVGRKLKSAEGWHGNNGTDDAGFNALPGGCRGYGGFEGMGFCGYFWTASPAGDDNGWRRGICADANGICREEDRRYFGVSVRCVRDAGAQ